jgi:hypothetical protein
MFLTTDILLQLQKPMFPLLHSEARLANENASAFSLAKRLERGNPNMVPAILKTLVSLTGIIVLASFVIDHTWGVMKGLGYMMEHPGVFLNLGTGREWDRLMEYLREERANNILWKDLAWPSDVAFRVYKVMREEIPYHLEAHWYLLRHPEVRARYRRRKWYRRRLRTGR